uniref:Uncharacterized protein n=1 Tax=Corethron hystrix TaxID=216773 RepID=A0A7S1BZU7_9STRA|mmetsp:Transcript_8629/g.18981  ORF Transcript_8629/g.18981 Transcript_8629/m.18981 type:complete len:187 (+) Transcript_8629:203-763(+)
MENGKTPLVLPFEEPGTAERRRRGEERREEEAVATPGILLPVPVFAERNNDVHRSNDGHAASLRQGNPSTLALASSRCISALSCYFLTALLPRENGPIFPPCLATTYSLVGACEIYDSGLRRPEQPPVAKPPLLLPRPPSRPASPIETSDRCLWDGKLEPDWCLPSFVTSHASSAGKKSSGYRRAS